MIRPQLATRKNGHPRKWSLLIPRAYASSFPIADMGFAGQGREDNQARLLCVLESRSLRQFFCLRSRWQLLNNLRSQGALVAAIILGIGADPAQGASVEIPAATYVQAFQETCRKGFPKLDEVAQSALLSGWQERSVRPVGPFPSELAASLPQAFRKGGIMLFLTRPQAGPFKGVCQIASSAQPAPASSDIIAALTPIMNGIGPVLTKSKASDQATWSLGQNLEVQAGTRGTRKTRTAFLVARERR